MTNCKNCGRAIPATKRPDAQYCSHACRELQKRRRQGIGPRGQSDARHRRHLSNVKQQSAAFAAALGAALGKSA